MTEASERDSRLQEHALRFLSRGVVHKMNNALAVFSSHAQLLELAPSERPDVRALETSVRRSQRVLGLLELVLGPASSRERHCIGSLLRSLSATLLCEQEGQRYVVGVVAEPQVWVVVSAPALLIALLHLIEQLAPDPSAALPGSIELRLETGDRPRIVVQFRHAEGFLPLGRRITAVAADLESFAAEHGIGLEVDTSAPAYTVTLPAAC